MRFPAGGGAAGGATAKKTLTDLDEALDGIVRGWTETLRTNLEDPTVSGNIDLVTDAAASASCRAFSKSKQLPDPVSPAFVKALQEVLGGLQKVTLASARCKPHCPRAGYPALSAI